MRFSLAIALALFASDIRADPARLEFSSRFVAGDWSDEYGGLSGIHVHPGGTRATLVGDRGRLFDVGLTRRSDGTLASDVLLNIKILHLYDPAVPIDTEGLVVSDTGDVFISTEGPPLILHYDAARSWPTVLAAPPELPVPRSNRGFEALAQDSTGGLITLPEVPQGPNGFPLLRLKDGVWDTIAHLPHIRDYQVVGADVDHQNRLYILERAVSLLGFRSQIRRLDLNDLDQPAEVLWTSTIVSYDNLEGLSLWRDETGQTRVVLVSDNNFFKIQRSEFVELILIE
ncbi:MAG: esterase-like activity of phytase family protein [Paracoccaceae bacterium]